MKYILLVLSLLFIWKTLKELSFNFNKWSSSKQEKFEKDVKIIKDPSINMDRYFNYFIPGFALFGASIMLFYSYMSINLFSSNVLVFLVGCYMIVKTIWTTSFVLYRVDIRKEKNYQFVKNSFSKSGFYQMHLFSAIALFFYGLVLIEIIKTF